MPFTAPAGKTLVLTDFYLQNPQGDAGKLELLVDDAVLHLVAGHDHRRGRRSRQHQLASPLDDRRESVDVGGWLARSARGCGLSVAAFRAGCRMCFEAFGYQRLVARVEVGNHASLAVAEIVGFRVDGISPGDFGGRGAWIASLLPHELRDAGSPEPENARRTRAFGTGIRRRRRVQASGGEITLRALADRDLDDIIAA